MSFFDSKEEVINIELTQYGKEQFSKGLFQPAYYAFYDDDIIYDFSWAGGYEEQNLIESRIMEESIYLKPVYNFSDRMKENDKYTFFKSTPSKKRLKDSINISNNNSENNYTPAWDIKILNGSCLSYTTSSAENILNLNLNDSSVFIKGSSFDNLTINNDSIILEIEEINCTSQKENFEIEFYEISDEVDSFGKNKLIQLSFGNDPIYIKDGILLDNPIFPEIEPENNPSNVEYYFKISTDKKIDNLTLKEIKEKQKNIYRSIVTED